MKNILVTGGSGFLGSYIIDQLKQEGFNPISFSRNQSEKLKVKNIFTTLLYLQYNYICYTFHK